MTRIQGADSRMGRYLRVPFRKRIRERAEKMGPAPHPTIARRPRLGGGNGAALVIRLPHKTAHGWDATDWKANGRYLKAVRDTYDRNGFYQNHQRTGRARKNLREGSGSG